MDTSNLTPQDKAINHSLPIQTWELYEYDERIYAHRQDWIPWFRLKAAYEVYYEFKGRTATYCICSQDNNITKAMALEWAKLHHAGRVQHLSLDLEAYNRIGKQKR